jgi:hypothetical protein
MDKEALVRIIRAHEMTGHHRYLPEVGHIETQCHCGEFTSRPLEHLAEKILEA